MQTNAPALSKALSTYVNSTEVEKLENELKAINQAIKSKAYDDVLDDLYYIMLRIVMKSSLLGYIHSSYTLEEYQEAKTRIEKVIAISETKKFDEAISIGKKVLIVLEELNQELNNYANINTFIQNWSFDYSIFTLIEGKEKIDELEKTKAKIEALTLEESLFEKQVKMIDYKKLLLEKIEKQIKDLDEIYHNKKDGENNRFIASSMELFSDHFKDFYDFVPSQELLMGETKLEIVHSPFPKEVELLVDDYQKAHNLKFYYLDVERFLNLDNHDKNTLIDIINERKMQLYIDGINNYLTKQSELSADLKILLMNLLLVSSKGSEVIILDTDGENYLYGRLYNLIDNELKEEKISPSILHYTYCSMPCYNDLIAIFIEKKMIQESDDETKLRIKKNMPFLGFVGLNKMIRSYHEGRENFLAIGEEISRMNYNLNLNNYLSLLPRLELLIDSGWGEKFDYKNFEEENTAFDYDSIRGIKAENLKKIDELNADYFTKAGLFVKYSLLAGESKEKWTELEDDVKKERVTNAVKLLYHLFSIQLDVKVEIKKLNSGTLGLCSENGSLLEFDKSTVKDYATISDVVLHECFHAFQHKAITGAYYRWFWTNLGVTEGRVNEWKLNYQTYITPEVANDANKDQEQKIDFYRLQVYETEANAFSKDALLKAEEVWNILNID